MLGENCSGRMSILRGHPSVVMTSKDGLRRTATTGLRHHPSQCAAICVGADSISPPSHSHTPTVTTRSQLHICTATRSGRVMSMTGCWAYTAIIHAAVVCVCVCVCVAGILKLTLEYPYSTLLHFVLFILEKHSVTTKAEWTNQYKKIIQVLCSKDSSWLTSFVSSALLHLLCLLLCCTLSFYLPMHDFCAPRVYATACVCEGTS